MWAKIDDQWFCHPKTVGLSLAARGLWATVLSWTCSKRTPHVPEHMAPFLAGGEDVDDLAAELVEVGKWHGPGHDCDDCEQVESGWIVHGWYRRAQFEDSHVEVERSKMNTTLARRVAARDGFVCNNCGVGCCDLQIDHILPVSRGGLTEFGNLQLLCGHCNRAKSDMLPKEWERIRTRVGVENDCHVGCSHWDAPRWFTESCYPPALTVVLTCKQRKSEGAGARWKEIQGRFPGVWKLVRRVECACEDRSTCTSYETDHGFVSPSACSYFAAAFGPDSVGGKKEAPLPTHIDVLPGGGH